MSALTIFVHANFKAFAQAASPALVAVRLVHEARPFTFGLAHVLAIPANRALFGGKKIQ